jgi:hypothetical protein
MNELTCVFESRIHLICTFSIKIWYAIFYRKAYSGNEPAFYERDDFDWSKTIETGKATKLGGQKTNYKQ